MSSRISLFNENNQNSSQIRFEWQALPSAFFCQILSLKESQIMQFTVQTSYFLSVSIPLSCLFWVE